MGRADARRARLRAIAAAAAFVVAAFVVAACDFGTTTGPTARTEPTAQTEATGSADSEPPATASGEPTDTGSPTDSASPTATPVGGPSPSDVPGATPTSAESPSGITCTGNAENLEFFRQAAIAMSWAVYCGVVPGGWFLETGSYRLADGGRLEVTYRGPSDAHLALVEGNVCAGANDIETCAPRDAVIGPALFGDLEGELGRLSNGLVLDVDRGATPSWRATGLGISEDDFRAICAALLHVEG